MPNPLYHYQIEPRAPHLGGGWRVRCFKDNLEVACGNFPLEPELDPEEADNQAHCDAMNEGEAWLASYIEPIPAFDDHLKVAYPVILSDGRIAHKQLESLTAADLNALIDAESTAATAELRHADALQAYMDNKTWIGSGPA